MTYADANATVKALHGLGRCTRRAGEVDVSIDYAYDEMGRLTSVTDAAGNVTSYSYNLSYNLNYSYNEAGNGACTVCASNTSLADASGFPLTSGWFVGSCVYGY